ncbi:MAG: hypothetical protein HYX69_06995 [Planctomycetia bacterium]|nr:hypothetical protein [Planctomycetia bacterium]
MSRFRFELATEADDADLRAILAATPMEGDISVAFLREPSFFAAAAADGRFRQVVACRDGETGHLVGFGCRSVCDRYVNGRPWSIGYLSTLRLLSPYRNRGLVARGYAYFRRLHGDGRTPLYLTTVAEGNDTAFRVLTGARAGLPCYHPAGRFATVAMPIRRRAAPCASAESTGVRPAGPGAVPQLIEFWNRHGPSRQFFPTYRAEDFAPGGLLATLPLRSVLVSVRGGQIVGTLAAWDQHNLRQAMVRGYGGALAWLRPLYNMASRWRGLPRLPAPGETFRFLTAALVVVKDEDAEIFRELVETALAQAAGGPHHYLMLGLHESDPLLRALAPLRGPRYNTRLYFVGWDDAETLRRSIDARPPYLELGTL